MCIPIWHICLGFFSLLQIVTSVNICMIHFSTFGSRESDSVVSALGSHSHCLLFSQRKKPTQLQNTWKPESISSSNFSANQIHISQWPFCPFPCSVFLSLEQEIAQLGLEGDCGDTRWSSQCGELFWSVTIFQSSSKE